MWFKKKKNGNTTRPWKGKVISYRLVEFFPNQTLCFFTSFFSFLFKVIKQELARWSLGISQFFFMFFLFLKKGKQSQLVCPLALPQSFWAWHHAWHQSPDKSGLIQLTEASTWQHLYRQNAPPKQYHPKPYIINSIANLLFFLHFSYSLVSTFSCTLL